MQNCIEHAKEKGYVETLFGRRRPLPELASSNFQVRSSGERMARNTPIQAPRRISLSWPWCMSGSACGTKNYRPACYCRYTMN